MTSALDMVPRKEDRETTYFAFRIPTDQHRQLRALLAGQGVTVQAFFHHMIAQFLLESAAHTQ